MGFEKMIKKILYLLLAFSAPIYSTVEYTRYNSLKIEEMRSHAKEDPQSFWEQEAKKLDWFTPWEKALHWERPFAKWFVKGQINASYNCLDRHLSSNKEKPALIWVNEAGHTSTVSYGQLHAECCQIANALKSLSVSKGDCVAIFMPMTIEGVASMLACARLGAPHVVIFGGTGKLSLQEKLQYSQAKVVITSDGGNRRGRLIPYKPVLDKIIDECPSVEHVIVLNHADQPIDMDSKRDHWYSELVKTMPNDCPCEETDSENPLFILFTSGTTGKPKGILHTTGGYLVGVNSTFEWVFDPSPNDVYWCTADIGWITGHSYVVYGPLLHGMTQLIYEGSLDYPSQDISWKLIEQNKVSTFYTAPTLIRSFVKWGEELVNACDTSSLKLLGSIGEPLNPEVWHWYSRVVGKGNCPIVDTWFQTETGSFVLAPIPGISPQKPGSVTKPLPGYEAQVMDLEGNISEKGFLAITSPFPSMLRGVFQDNERYQRTYWNHWNGQYYFAGDAAECDMNGDFWIRGRSDEVIIVAGHNIGTAETENVLVKHPCVAEAAVVGIPDELKGHAIVAFIVLKDHACASDHICASIKSFVAENQGPIARPSFVAVVKELPKTRSGKILRRCLLKMMLGQPLGDCSSLENKQALDHLYPACENIGKQAGIYHEEN